MIDVARLIGAVRDHLDAWNKYRDALRIELSTDPEKRTPRIRKAVSDGHGLVIATERRLRMAAEYAPFAVADDLEEDADGKEATGER